MTCKWRFYFATIWGCLADACFLKWCCCFCGMFLYLSIWCQVPWFCSDLLRSLGHTELINDSADSPPWNCNMCSDKLECPESHVAENYLSSSLGNKWGEPEGRYILLSHFLIFCEISDYWLIFFFQWGIFGNMLLVCSMLFHKPTPNICVSLTHFLTFLFSPIQ